MIWEMGRGCFSEYCKLLKNEEEAKKMVSWYVGVKWRCE
jgi:hypothetical protein